MMAALGEARARHRWLRGQLFMLKKLGESFLVGRGTRPLFR